MFMKIGIGGIVTCALSALIVPSASAFPAAGLAWELADGLGYNQSTGRDTPYEWFVQPLKLRYDVESRDGTWSDGRSYVTLKGTDASPQGHCLQINFMGGVDQPSAIDIYVKDHATNKFVYALDPGHYAIRLWVNKNTGAAGSTLPWTVYFVADDMGFAGDFDISIRRIEVGKAACAANQAADPWNSDPGVRWPWITVEGNSAAYTVAAGHF